MADIQAARWELSITDTAKFSCEHRQIILAKIRREIHLLEYLLEVAKRYATPQAISIMEREIAREQAQPPDQASDVNTSNVAQHSEASSQPLSEPSQLPQPILETEDSSSSSSSPVVIAHGSSIRAPLSEREVFIDPALLVSSIEEDEDLSVEERANTTIERVENLPMDEVNDDPTGNGLLVDPELFAVHEVEMTDDELHAEISHLENYEPQSTSEDWENDGDSQLDRDGDVIMSTSMEEPLDSIPDLDAPEAVSSPASTASMASMEDTLSSESSGTLVNSLPQQPPPLWEATTSNLYIKRDHLPDSVMLPRRTRISFQLTDYINQIELTRMILQAQETNASASRNTNCQVESSAAAVDSSDDSDSDGDEDWVPSLIGPGGRYELYTDKPVRASDLIALHHEIAELTHFLKLTQYHYDQAEISRKDGLKRGKRLLSAGQSSYLREAISADEKWPEGEWGMPPPKPPRHFLDLGHVFRAKGVTDYKIGDGYAPTIAARPARRVR